MVSCNVPAEYRKAESLEVSTETQNRPKHYRTAQQISNHDAVVIERSGASTAKSLHSVTEAGHRAADRHRQGREHAATIARDGAVDAPAIVVRGGGHLEVIVARQTDRTARARFCACPRSIRNPRREVPEIETPLSIHMPLRCRPPRG